MPSSTGWCTTPTGSNSTDNPSERKTLNYVTKRQKTDIKNQGLTATRQSWADTPVQMGGCCRNRWADIPEYASTATLTSYCQMQRFNLLAAIGMSASQPVLKAAFVLRNDAPTIENLRRAFPYQRRLLKIVIKLSDDLNRKIPRREKSEHLTAKPRDAATTYLVSKHSLTAARQAIEELGPNAPRHKLLSYAATILEKQ